MDHEKKEINMEKLGKLDKLLSKVQLDINKRVKDQDKAEFLQTLRKVYNIKI